MVTLGIWELAEVAVKLVVYGASFAAAGAAFFLVVFRAQLERDEDRRIAGLACGLGMLAIVATILRVAVITGRLGGEWASLWNWELAQLVLQSGEGMASGLRIFGASLLLSSFSGLWPLRFVAAGGGIAICLSFTFVGHAGAFDLQPLPRLLVALHLVGVAYWVGALWPLRQLTGAADIVRMATIMKRFGDIALFVVPGLIVAGAALLWIYVDDPAQFIRSDYGRLFIAKLALVALLLALAAFNKLRFVPHIARGETAAVAQLRRSISLEMTAVALVLLVTAFFTTVTGPPSLS